MEFGTLEHSSAFPYINSGINRFHTLFDTPQFHLLSPMSSNQAGQSPSVCHYRTGRWLIHSMPSALLILTHHDLIALGIQSTCQHTESTLQLCPDPVESFAKNSLEHRENHTVSASSAVYGLDRSAVHRTRPFVAAVY